ncbi:hypothetical protein FSP39_010302 [Pinctada imbricata]|uniref:Uncharacterized protein n=1 Tax=Pinctada imbricata TaxID=66713 RepID=A0AA88YNG6_PINIB|nr:hypothetical protein FSP39_010302 [Pinctada imbricata]
MSVFMEVEESDRLSDNVDKSSQKFIIKYKSKRMRVATPSSTMKQGKRVARDSDIGTTETPMTFLRIGKTMMFCHDISRNLENEIGAAPVSRDHKAQDVTSDMQKTVSELLKAKVFHHIPGRNHTSFPNEPSDIVRQFDVAAFHQWLATKKSEYARNKRAF